MTDIIGGAPGLDRVFGAAPTPSNPAGLVDAKATAATGQRDIGLACGWALCPCGGCI